MKDLDFIAAETQRLMLGGTCATPTDQPPLTFDKLRALHNFLKPEKLTVGGEELEIYGFNVHSKFHPPGITVLTEKEDPNATIPKLGKLVVIDENVGKALIYDPPKQNLELLKQ